VTQAFKEKAAEAPESPESRNLNVLLNLAYMTNEEKDLSRLLHRCAELLAKSLEADHVYVLWVKSEAEAQEDYEIMGRYSREGETPRRPAFPGNRQGLLEVRPVHPHFRRIDDGQFNVMASVVMKQLRSSFASPCRSSEERGRALRSLEEARAFSSEALELASAVGIQLGTTIGLLKMVRRSDKMFRDSIRTIVSAMEMRAPELRGKSERVATYCLALARSSASTRAR